MAHLRITITDDQGEVYSSGPVERDDFSWWFTDEDGDRELLTEVLTHATAWVREKGGGHDA